ncbi:malonyl-ACP O-methyltransferase BioC [Vibrio spartinae]|uniref:Malonyl-[acyl-carrier protein] O-methyltransferase n=1 Tax=Vibrio spartinae TaxID=1918945 RepID=A0A1N6M627_9VIBR|nr:malonyl-ACP O-methyltransferase BioC [Vibrio spartinae]SIO94898.1 Malonyl-[acyl-carrier protein] O-methyltransferase [Vibrio spartinae]
MVQRSLSSFDSRRKARIAAAFGKAAQSYDRHAAFQRDVGQQLLNELPPDLRGCVVLDLGCGTGFFSEQMRQRGAEVICADLSQDMLAQARQRCGMSGFEYYHCDAEALPLADHSVDIVFSSLALQWCESLSVPLREIKRVLKPAGKGYFSILVAGSLVELEQAWAKVDSAQHVNRFISENAVKIALAQAECTPYQIDLSSFRLWYDSAMHLMKDLKGIGATHIDGRTNRPISHRMLAQVEAAYQTFANREGLLPATYQVCFGVIHQ